ncbi:MAG: sugar phosphate isomerase/epimerase [Planctomycetes bacterium]|nr:sugar phosphate isomerase/epimerase [Planctomycetota bacterium]
MTQPITRRRFVRFTASGAAIGLLGANLADAQAKDKKQPLYKISLAAYSLHRTLAAEKLDYLDLAPLTKKEFGIDAVEHWNRPYADKAQDKKYLAELKKRSDDAGVKSLLIMIDSEGNLGDPSAAKLNEAVDRHKKWVEAAKFLGCHSIRVNARSRGSYDEQLKLATSGLRKLSQFAAGHEINVIVENHGGLSSNGAWLAEVMKRVDLKNCGTLPDFGNFGGYDRYKGVRELMPYAKAVSAKSNDFDEAGNEKSTDYAKMMKIVVDAGYHGYVGIEFSGGRLSEIDGIRATQKLLLKVRKQLST